MLMISTKLSSGRKDHISIFKMLSRELFLTFPETLTRKRTALREGCKRHENKLYITSSKEYRPIIMSILKAIELQDTSPQTTFQVIIQAVQAALLMLILVQRMHLNTVL